MCGRVHLERLFPQHNIGVSLAASLPGVALCIYVHHGQAAHLALLYMRNDVAGVHAIKVRDVAEDVAAVMVPADSISLTSDGQSYLQPCISVLRDVLLVFIPTVFLC